LKSCCPFPSRFGLGIGYWDIGWVFSIKKECKIFQRRVKNLKIFLKISLTAFLCRRVTQSVGLDIFEIFIKAKDLFFLSLKSSKKKLKGRPLNFNARDLFLFI
jgi:hypothetical protein